MNKLSTIDQPVVIYGGGQIGVGFCRRLLQGGVNVCAIIDRNPEGVTNSPVPVMTVEACIQKNRSARVFVAIGNGLAHPPIARTLRSVGFTRILHLPAFLRGEKAAAMTRAWNAFYSGDHAVPFANFDELYTVRAGDYLLSALADYVTAIVHKDYVYTVRRSYDGIDHDYADYFKWKNQEQDVIDKATNVRLDDPVVKDLLPFEALFTREQMDFYHAKTFFDMGDYYREAASVAVFDSAAHRFNILDGSHRAFYLERQGFEGIPLKMKREEWEAYFRERQAQALMDYCRQLQSLPTVVKHPAFMSFPVCEREPDADFLHLLKGVCPV
ncbi:MAG: hypothetical protein P0Y58_09890 [Candidatus Pseudomonas phytovorans]|uniref:Uncharacterized protein n=1 Tax=Candidatus Pseudomonas phytovorans TaxID=3121377 RepID=A0AAJ5WKX1_9PSED|nr:hypothetical protein [Pseudomonas sp.]WEK32476.1 MAG: hypothetical protein P0Y58_09890 [Pseudomonas sp.]